MRLFLALLIAMSLALPVQAASCWNHNGSIMRLEANGTQRWFVYAQPRAGLASAGVYSGTLLFNGEKLGNSYRGIARVFSPSCPGEPLEYYVEGPVAPSQTQVTLYGQREVYANCGPTGQFTNDTLVFTYLYQC